MRAVIKIFLLVQFAALIVSCTGSGETQEIKRAVSRQMEYYPRTTLIDIYKSFFQDEFGPGHLLEDTSAAWQYFTRELENMQSHERYSVEWCGMGRNFIRVPMDLVKDGLISPEVYFDAFMESSSAFDTPDIEAWKEEWSEILDVITGMDLGLEGFDKDRKALADMLDSGQAMVHHSKQYRELYEPHYRIMTLDQWEKIQFAR
jgi:hypothetical protein